MAKINPVPSVNLPPKPVPAPLPPQEKGIGPGGCVPGPDFPKPGSFEAKDKNNDDKLNADEFNEGRGVIDKVTDPDKFDRYDANNDGYVTKLENAAGEFRDAIGDYRKSQQQLPNHHGNTGPKPPDPEQFQLKADAPKGEAEVFPTLPPLKRSAD